MDEEELREFVRRGQERGRIAFRHESVEKTLASLGLLAPDGRLTNAVDVISPGWFIDGQSPEEHLGGQSTSSDMRNRLIADTLFRSGDIEFSGLGLPLMRDVSPSLGRSKMTPFSAR